MKVECPRCGYHFYVRDAKGVIRKVKEAKTDG